MRIFIPCRFGNPGGTIITPFRLTVVAPESCECCADRWSMFASADGTCDFAGVCRRLPTKLSYAVLNSSMCISFLCFINIILHKYD